MVNSIEQPRARSQASHQVIKAASVSSRMTGTTLVMVLHVLTMPFLVSLTKPSLILFVVIGIGRVGRILIVN
jgi:hypothetical protein